MVSLDGYQVETVLAFGYAMYALVTCWSCLRVARGVMSDEKILRLENPFMSLALFVVVLNYAAFVVNYLVQVRFGMVMVLDGFIIGMCVSEIKDIWRMRNWS